MGGWHTQEIDAVLDQIARDFVNLDIQLRVLRDVEHHAGMPSVDDAFPDWRDAWQKFFRCVRETELMLAN